MTAPMLRAEQIPLDMLTPHPRNPRKISAARLAALERVLAADPEMLEARPLIALPDGTLVAGNQRWRAARSLRDAGDARFATVPTIHVDLEEPRATEWALRDNEGFGVRDDDLTRTLLEELAEAGRTLELPGLTEHDLQRLLGQRTAGDADSVPPAPKVGVSVRGEVYKLGPHSVMCGDATDPADVDRLLEDCPQPVDIVWTDPPYGVGLQILDPDEARRRRRRDGRPGRRERRSRPASRWRRSSGRRSRRRVASRRSAPRSTWRTPTPRASCSAALSRRPAGRSARC